MSSRQASTQAVLNAMLQACVLHSNKYASAACPVPSRPIPDPTTDPPDPTRSPSAENLGHFPNPSRSGRAREPQDTTLLEPAEAVTA